MVCKPTLKSEKLLLRNVQVQLLRACAVQGSFARLQGAILGGEYMTSRCLTRENSEAALKISQQKIQ